MSNSIEGATTGAERLKSKQTVADILEVACSFEATARDFYRQLLGQVGERMQDLVAELAVEEQRHFDLLADLAARPDIAEHIDTLLEEPASHQRFIDASQLPDLGAYPDDQAILQYAIGREEMAYEEYNNLAEQAPPGPIKDVFRFLAREELNHKADLERLYGELVHGHWSS